MSRRDASLTPRTLSGLLGIDHLALIGVVLLSAFLRMGYLGAASAWHDYDEGVHLTAALMSNRGLTPYKEFFFAHPPLIIYILSPLATSGGEQSFASARLISGIIGTLTLIILAVAASLSIGRRAALLGTTFLAIDGYTSYNSRMVMLEPYVDFFLSLGFLSYILSRRVKGPAWVLALALIAGVAFGLAVASKLTGVFGLLAFTAFCILMKRTRDLVLILPTASLTFVALSAPFLVTAADEFIKQVLIFHLVRPEDGVPLSERASWILTSPLDLGVVWAGLASLAISIPLTTYMRSRKLMRSETYLWITWSLAYILMYSLTKTFYGHYLQHLVTPLSYVPGIVVESVGRVDGRALKRGVLTLNNLLKVFSAYVGLALLVQFTVIAYSAPPFRTNETPLIVAERLKESGQSYMNIIAFEPIYTFLVDKYPANRVADSYGHMIYIGSGLSGLSAWEALLRYLNKTLYSSWPIHDERAQRSMLGDILSSDIVIIDWRARWQMTRESLQIIYRASVPKHYVGDIEIRIITH
jgi:4-amino-4-deoxy-L-arabinose transferase-like glycosyltransferase